jgi:hypothetical protein
MDWTNYENNLLMEINGALMGINVFYNSISLLCNWMLTLIDFYLWSLPVFGFFHHKWHGLNGFFMGAIYVTYDIWIMKGWKII